jgi:hypothetical protein
VREIIETDARCDTGQLGDVLWSGLNAWCNEQEMAANCRAHLLLQVHLVIELFMKTNQMSSCTILGCHAISIQGPQGFYLREILLLCCLRLCILDTM